MANMTPIQLMNLLRQSGGNPEAVARVLMQQNLNNNPDLANVFQLAQSGDTNALRNFAVNLFNQRGRNFDQEFSNFLNLMNPNGQ